MAEMARRRAPLAAMIALIGLTGCQYAPGPWEQQANAYAMQCQQGDQQACQAYWSVAPGAQAERAQREANNAVATGVVAGLAGVAAGAAIGYAAAPRSYYYGPRYGYYGPRYGYGYRRW